MKLISREILEFIKEEYPKGTRVKLLKTDDEGSTSYRCKRYSNRRRFYRFNNG